MNCMICMIFPLRHLDLSRQTSDMYDLADAAGWEPYDLHDLAHVFRGWVCTVHILHNILYRQIQHLDDLDRWYRS